LERLDAMKKLTDVQKQDKRKEETLKKYPEGGRTKSGCKILKVYFNRGNSKQTVLKVECVETGKVFCMFTQVAHQTKYHPSIRAKKLQDKKNAGKRKARLTKKG